MTYPAPPPEGPPAPHTLQPPPPPDWAPYPWVRVPSHPRSGVALALGILSVVGVSVLGPLAWYFGAVARRDIDREPGRWQGRSQATAGMVMGVIGTALLVLGLMLLLLIVAGIAIVNGYDSGYPRS